MLSRMFSVFSVSKAPQYHAVDAEALLKSQDASDTDSVEHISNFALERSPRRGIVAKIILVFLAISSIFLNILLVFKDPSISKCIERTSIWSPANAVVKYQEFDFDNDFAHKTKYRGPPTPELEKNWEELWWLNGVRFPEDKINLINRTHDLGNGRKPREAVDGNGGYHVMIDVFHQLHCLNLLRQATWLDYYRTHTRVIRTPAPFSDSDVGIRMHLDHCIETLRLTLMCHADTTPSLMIEDPESPLGVSTDFSSHRKCRNFEDIRDWTRNNQIAPTVPMEWAPEKVVDTER